MGDPDDLPQPGWLWVVGRGGQAPLISRFAPVPPGINHLGVPGALIAHWAQFRTQTGLDGDQADAPEEFTACTWMQTVSCGMTLSVTLVPVAVTGCEPGRSDSVYFTT